MYIYIFTKTSTQKQIAQSAVVCKTYRDVNELPAKLLRGAVKPLAQAVKTVKQNKRSMVMEMEI